MRVTSVESTELFVGTPEQPHQVVAAEIEHVPGRSVRVTVEGAAHGETVVPVGESGTVRAEIPVTGADGPITVTASDGDESASGTGGFTVAEPGWTMFMVSHFHYDPVWWNTQGAYTETWDVADRWYALADILAGPRQESIDAADQIIIGYGGTGITVDALSQGGVTVDGRHGRALACAGGCRTGGETSGDLFPAGGRRHERVRRMAGRGRRRGRRLGGATARP